MNFLDLILLIVILIIGFGVACYLVKLHYGCTTEEAVKKILDFLVGTAPPIPSYENFELYSEVWETIKTTISESNYADIQRLLKKSSGIWQIIILSATLKKYRLHINFGVKCK